MAETNNIPPEWQALVLQAIAESYEKRAEVSRTVEDMLAEIRQKFAELMAASGRDPQQIPLYMDDYLGRNLTRIVHYALWYADQNPPTHRKGYGDAFREIIRNPDDLLFVFAGGLEGGWPQGPGEGFPEPEPYEPLPSDGTETGPQELPSHIYNIAIHMEDRFGYLNFGSDDDRRQWTRMVAEQAVYEFPNEGWGHKSSTPSHPPSKDAIARRTGNLIEAWDIVNGSTRRVTRGVYHNISNQHFIEVPPVNHLGI